MPAEHDVRPSRPADEGITGRNVVRVVGELGLDHVRAVDEALLAVLADADGPTEIVVDLSNSSFCDSSGLNALLRARELGLRAGHTLVVLAAPSHQLLRLLHLTGSADLFLVRSA
ncbi:STAS domain-containing protein [Streptomyces sp. NBC_01205]|uniref:STAS domain-containing protein n=1 Tax=Streptomyces sp. NBC_01205 TaxID=2903771 RepID=UPI002E0DAF7D|nr:STAS domain-containing protein [Streptomyces sp. NBC_01205]